MAAEGESVSACGVDRSNRETQQAGTPSLREAEAKTRSWIATCHGLSDKGRKGSKALRRQAPGQSSRVARELAQAIEVVPVERDAQTGRAKGKVGARLFTYLPN